MEFQPRRTQSTSSPLWQPQISISKLFLQQARWWPQSHLVDMKKMEQQQQQQQKSSYTLKVSL
jgi:hypothetical protein